MEKATILVTGGFGYIGKNIVNLLIEENYEVIIVDNLQNSKKIGLVNKDKFHNVDITSYEKLERVFAKHRIDLIIHCAALIKVGESNKNPIDYYNVNVGGTINIIKLMKKYNVKNIIFSSSAAVYGAPIKVPIKENANKKPINIYGKTKLIAENLILDSEVLGLKSIIFRYFNVAGADLKSNLFYNPLEKSSHLIPIINDVIMNLQSKLVINGKSYNTKDGTCIRDYIHVVDLANAHVMGVNYLLKKKKSQIFNISSGESYSNLEIYNILKNELNLKIEMEFGLKRDGDPDILIADNKKIIKELKWKPTKSIKNMIIDDLETRKLNLYK